MFTSTGADKTLTCSDCQQTFEFTASEQQFYSDRGFTEPRRCPSCRASRKAARDNGGSSYGSDSSYGSSSGSSYGGGSRSSYGGGQREMFSATCSSCGKDAQVPFKPSGSKPVYCSDCFQSQRRSY